MNDWTRSVDDNRNRSTGNSNELICPSRTPGTTGLFDQGDPNVYSLPGFTPGPTGISDYAELTCRPDSFLPVPQKSKSSGKANKTSSDSETSDEDLFSEEPQSGSIAVATGVASIVRIPVPGSHGLFIELSPRGYVPGSGSTSTLFVQDAIGNRHLRLDYGYNKATGKIDYHWNQKGTHAQFGIQDHTPAGRGGQALYKGAKYFRYGGRVLLVAGAAIDIYSIVVAKKRWRQVTKVAAGWAGAWAGCKVVGAGGATVGTFIEPAGGSAVGGFLGCIVGGIGGYAGFSWAAGEIYDEVEETFFEPVPETKAPPASAKP
jgi:hypothetical protein